MVEGESLGVTVATPLRAQAKDRGLTLHQGGMCDTPSGEWWCTIMSDHGSGGRMVSLVPITRDDGFPLIGLPGNLRKAPNTWFKPDTGFTQPPMPTYVPEDHFNHGKLNPHWQWNHVASQALERALLAPALGVAEGADDRELPADQRRVRGEHEIGEGRGRARRIDLHVAGAVEHFHQTLPTRRTASQVAVPTLRVIHGLMS